MDGGLTTTIASAGISAVGAAIAVWQAVIARNQATTATEAAQLAERQAVAAENQVTLMRRQLDAEDAERRDARGPQFTIESGYTDVSNTDVPRGVLTLKQTSGPALARVTVTAAGQGVEGLRGSYDPDSLWGYQRVEGIEIGPMASGASETVYVDLNFHTHETSVVLHLSCQARSTSEVWERSAAQDIQPRPERPPWASRRSR